MYFESDKLREFGVMDYIVLCIACTKADYTPPNWEFILLKLKSFKFGHYLVVLEKFDWLEFVLDLDKLGHCDTYLIQKIINNKYMQSKEFYDSSKIEKLKKILERENVSCGKTDRGSDIQNSNIEYTDGGPSFYNDLKKIFGANHVWTKLQIDSELTLPYALKIDLETGDFLPISKEPTAEENADKVL